MPPAKLERIWVRVMRPEATPDGDWKCHLDGHDIVRGPRAGVHGVNSLQALSLAIRLARQLLRDFVARGGRLYLCEDGSGEVDVDVLFGDDGARGA